MIFPRQLIYLPWLNRFIVDVFIWPRLNGITHSTIVRNELNIQSSTARFKAKKLQISQFRYYRYPF